MIAILNRKDGQVIDLYPTLDSAKRILEYGKGRFTAINTNNSCHLVARYVELSSPNGYGQDSPEFESYGSVVDLFNNLYKWMNECTHIFGPDPRDVRDYFKNISVYLDGKKYEKWSESIDKFLGNKSVFL